MNEVSRKMEAEWKKNERNGLNVGMEIRRIRKSCHKKMQKWEHKYDYDKKSNRKNNEKKKNLKTKTIEELWSEK